MILHDGASTVCRVASEGGTSDAYSDRFLFWIVAIMVQSLQLGLIFPGAIRNMYIQALVSKMIMGNVDFCCSRFQFGCWFHVS